MKRAFMVGAIGLTLAYGVQAEAPTTATRAATRERLTQGRAVYNFRCYYCHGYSGNARTLAATFLTPAPADFTRASPERLTAAAIAETVRQGRAGTAMKPFASVISAAEIEAVSAFVHDEFVTRKAENTRYHTTENGWPNHERYRLAFPFATGEIPLSQPWESLTPEQSVGKRLYLDSCVSCHDRGAAGSDGPAWDSRPLSYPRNNFSLADPPVDATASASPYLKHEIPPKIRAMTATERRGEKLFQKNCAFCHGADGTGKNWIGSFMEPHPRNLTDPNFMSAMTRARLESAIREGLKDTSMPAWKTVLDAQQVRAIVAYINRAFHRLAD
ncbi:MAG TPA: c-type cytochrome [Rhodocyclaceae bacterium]|nr:c-type cytochrome [Rhodocyclaceae bacterium]